MRMTVKLILSVLQSICQSVLIPFLMASILLDLKLLYSYMSLMQIKPFVNTSVHVSQVITRQCDISGIGITNQRETTVVWDKVTGEPLHNAISKFLHTTSPCGWPTHVKNKVHEGSFLALWNLKMWQKEKILQVAIFVTYDSHQFQICMRRFLISSFSWFFIAPKNGKNCWNSQKW